MLHITSTEYGEASWQVTDDKRIAMESFTDYRSDAPAYRIRLDGTIVEIPNCTTPGLVYFGEGDQRPDLPLIRDWFPTHCALWRAVDAAYWDTVAPQSHSRLHHLDYPAYDYHTDQWHPAELREPSTPT